MFNSSIPKRMERRFWGAELSSLLKLQGLKSLAPGVLQFFSRKPRSQNLPDTEPHCRLHLAPLRAAGPEQTGGDCCRALQKGRERTWKKRIMFHISPRTKEGLPSAISAASMLTSFTCREAMDELSGVATCREDRWASDALVGLCRCHPPCSALPGRLSGPSMQTCVQACLPITYTGLTHTDTRLGPYKDHLSSPHTNPST